MAEASDNGPSQRRTGTRQPVTQAIERRDRDRAGRRESTSAEREAAAPATVAQDREGAALFPPRVTRKYYLMAPARGSDERRAYADERGEDLVFKDLGHRLTTRRHETAIVRDLVAIARHRDWSALQASGSRAFRREVWLEGHAHGIDVSGYVPTLLDRQVLVRRSDERLVEDRNGPARWTIGEDIGELRAEPIQDSDGKIRRSSESGMHDRRQDAAGSRSDQTPEAVSQRRDRLATIRRDGLRSRAMDRGIAQTRLAAAYSQIAVLDRALRRAFPNDAAIRETVLRTARERVAFHLEAGRALHHAFYSLPTAEKIRPLKQTRRRTTARSIGKRRNTKIEKNR